MKIINKIIFIIAFAVILINCQKSPLRQKAETAVITSFMDIPGITEDEIKAIEKLQSEYDSFIYGMTKTTETFFDSFSGPGGIRGFSVLFCKWMSELFGIEFIPALYKWSDLLAGLSNGEIDFTGDLEATDEREQTFYMTGPIAQRSLKIFQITGRPGIHDTVLQRPPRFVFLDLSEVFERVREAVEYEFETIPADSLLSAYHLLKDGAADALLVTGISEASFYEFNDISAETFLPLVFLSASMSTKNADFEPIISVVKKALAQGSTRRYLNELYNEGYQDYRRNILRLQFTDEEYEYIKNNPVITYAADPGNYPGSFFDKRDKKWLGSFFDIIDEINLLTGLSFERINDENSTWLEILPMLESGKAAMVPELTQTPEREGRFLWPDTDQMIDYYALISESGHPDINTSEIVYYKVGLAKNTAYTTIFWKWFPNYHDAFEYDTMDLAFDALRHGEIDYVMANQKRLLYLTNYLELPGYKNNIVFDQPLSIKFGINRDEIVLCSILNKTLRMIDTRKISEHWMHMTYDYRIKLREAQYPLFIGLSALIFCVFVLIVSLFIKSRRTGRRLENLVDERTHDLKLQTSMLMTILNSSPDFIFCKDLNLRYTRCNRSMEDFLNISSREIIGKTDSEIYGFSQQLADLYEREDRKVIDGKQHEIFEESIISQAGGGKKLIVETIKAPLIQDGEVIGIMGISRNITERKVTENNLSLQTAKLETIFNSIPDMVFCKDLNSKFTQCNKITEEYNVISEKELIGNNETEVLGFPPDLMAHILKIEQNVFTKGQIILDEETITFRDGVTRILETLRAPLLQNGVIVGLIGIAHDITKRKEMEEAALAASRSKSEFLANMSHEIRTPMNSIIGFTELAMDDKIQPKTEEYLCKILENAEGLLQIINNILDISKIESGKMELEKIPFDMHELLTSCRTLIMPKAVEKGIILHFYAEPSIGRKPMGDPTRLRQVLVNLLSNAVKFTNSGAVKVHVDIINRTENNTTIHFEVKDSGIGMNSRQIDRIFDPFMQAETGTTRKYGGTGLGLSITNNIINMMGGELLVESAPGIGSRFWFELTFDTMNVTEEEMLERKMVLGELEKPTFEGEVLLCEDNVMNQQVICEHLSRVGLKTIVADNGKSGVEMVKSRMEKGEKQFDLIFMDIHMPVMDGLEASDKILRFNTGIPLIAMTANIMSSDREIYRASGMNDYIGKPFTSQELWRCLVKYLKPVGWQTVNERRNSRADSKLRRKLIGTFVKDNRDRFIMITDALKDGDIKLAHRHAHSLKSNAGQIGKTVLQKAALEVEENLVNGKNLVTEEQLENLEAELENVLLQLTAQFAPEFPAKSNTESGHSGTGQQSETPEFLSFHELLEKLEPMLEMGNPDCRQYIEHLSRITGIDKELTMRLIQEMEDMDFEQAIITLGNLENDFGG